MGNLSVEHQRALERIRPYVARLARARVAAGLSQLEVASYVGVDQAAVSYWESGTNQPRFGNVILWAEAVGLSLDLTEGGDSMARGRPTPPPHDKPGGKGKIEGKPIGNQDPSKRGLGKTQEQHKKDK